MEKFPRLFKRAIPFRMNIRLEDFVKEYICMEQDIHIDDMQESVIALRTMRRRIEDTARRRSDELPESRRVRGRDGAQEDQLASLRLSAGAAAHDGDCGSEISSMLQEQMETGKEDLEERRRTRQKALKRRRKPFAGP